MARSAATIRCGARVRPGTRVRENTWLDPVPDPEYRYPDGMWYTRSAWGRESLRSENPDMELLREYYRPIWRWAEALQNDFASRADWCVKPYAEANHPPVVALAHARDLEARARRHRPTERAGIQRPGWR